MRAQLVQAARHHQCEAVLLPHGGFKAVDLTAESLGDRRIVVDEDAGCRFVVVKDPRFAMHHPVLGGREAHAIDNERCGVPLAQTAFVDDAGDGGGVPPEVHEGRPLAGGAARDQVVEGVAVGSGRRHPQSLPCLEAAREGHIDDAAAVNTTKVRGVKGKVIAITGAGSGIGRALALELAGRGARLALADIDAVTVEDTAALVRALGGAVHVACVDVADRAAVAAWAVAVVAAYGVVHQLYNNAGIGAAGRSIKDTDVASFERALAVNLWGVIHGTQEFLPHLIASGDGHVVTIGSLNALMGQCDLGAYCTSKFAVRGFTETLRAEMQAARLPVRVTLVHPGGVKTNIARAALTGGVLSDEQQREQARRVRIYDEQLLTKTATQTARTIVAGVIAGRERVLPGADVGGVDLVVRLLPTAYTRLVVWWQRRTFGDR